MHNMKKLPRVKFNEDLILTTEQLAAFYETSTTAIKQNFANNKDKFILGTHFYLLEGKQLKDFKNQVENFDLVAPRSSHLYLWTKRGAARHSKMLGTDRAWDMYDQLEENYFSPKQELDTSQLSPELQFMNGVVKKLAANELAQKQMNKKLDGIADIVGTSTMDWRNATSHLINAVVRVQGGSPEAYRTVRNDIYDEVDRRGAVSLSTRLTNLRRRMAEEGATKSKRDKTSKVDVIGNDKKLIEIYMAVVKDFAIKFGTWKQEY